MKQNQNQNKDLNQLLEQIATQHLFIQTLETQHRDRLDFHDVSVWGVKAALEAAYEAGLKAAQTTPTSTQS